jgi:hypothetical protein
MHIPLVVQLYSLGRAVIAQQRVDVIVSADNDLDLCSITHHRLRASVEFGSS